MGRFVTFYNSKAWKAARAQQLREQPWCGYCYAMGKVSEAAVVDHRVPLATDYERRLDPSNLQSLCKAHHDSTKQREERTGVRVGCDQEGNPIDPGHHWNA